MTDMNHDQAKNLVSTLRYIETVAENLLLSVEDEESEGELETLNGALSRVVRNLPSIHPDFAAITQEVDREALARGREWSKERAQKIALLRLSGDDTPEEKIPI